MVTNADALERYMLELINAERAAVGRAPLQLEQHLNQSAEDHSEWLLAENRFSHTGAGGSSAGDRMRDAGFDFSNGWAWGENLGYQTERGDPGLFDDVADIHGRLMNSSGHRANILSSNYDYVGIGVELAEFNGRMSVMITQNFARTGGDVLLDTGGGGSSPPPPDPVPEPDDPIAPPPAPPPGPNVVTGTSRGEQLTGTSDEDEINGRGGNDLLLGRDGDDTLSGGSGNDILRGQDGADELRGNSGFDRADYLDSDAAVRADLQNPSGNTGDATGDSYSSVEGLSGSAFDDRLSGNAGNNILVGRDGGDRLDGREGDDLLVGDTLPIHRLTEAAGQIFRLYQSTLNRDPDSQGFQLWTERLYETDWSLGDIADGFLQSNEFQSIYGSLNDFSFVTLLYQNVLGRTASNSEVANWVDQLDSGASRDEVVLGFSESAEFRINSAAEADAAALAASAPAWQDDVFRLYQATLDRTPDLNGFLNWSEQLAGGRGYLDVVDAFVGSDEFEATYGALNNQNFIELLYQNVLNRGADSDGLQGWLDVLDAGGSRSDIVRGFAQSDEFREATAADLADWIRDQGVHDVLDGGSGSNTLSGGMLSDLFVFSPSDDGNHLVLDLEAWDVLDFEGFGYGTTAELRANLADSGSNVVFSDAGVSIMFLNTDLSDFADEMLLI